jgi:hypothetical protein
VSRWPANYRVELEAFWRSHHEAWRRSDLNQREYCEQHGLPLKRFGNWRAKFKQEPEVAKKLLYRRSGGLSHMTKKASHMTSGVGLPVPGVTIGATGRIRRFSASLKLRPLMRHRNLARPSPRLPGAVGSRRAFSSDGKRRSNWSPSALFRSLRRCRSRTRPRWLRPLPRRRWCR